MDVSIAWNLCCVTRLRHVLNDYLIFYVIIAYREQVAYRGPAQTFGVYYSTKPVSTKQRKKQACVACFRWAFSFLSVSGVFGHLRRTVGARVEGLQSFVLCFLNGAKSSNLVCSCLMKPSNGDLIWGLRFTFSSTHSVRQVARKSKQSRQNHIAARKHPFKAVNGEHLKNVPKMYVLQLTKTYQWHASRLGPER